MILTPSWLREFPCLLSGCFSSHCCLSVFWEPRFPGSWKWLLSRFGSGQWWWEVTQGLGKGVATVFRGHVKQLWCLCGSSPAGKLLLPRSEVLRAGGTSSQLRQHALLFTTPAQGLVATSCYCTVLSFVFQLYKNNPCIRFFVWNTWRHFSSVSHTALSFCFPRLASTLTSPRSMKSSLKAEAVSYFTVFSACVCWMTEGAAGFAHLRSDIPTSGPGGSLLWKPTCVL